MTFTASLYVPVFLEFLEHRFGFGFTISPYSVSFSAHAPMLSIKFGVWLRAPQHLELSHS